jgi:hypothetical protein
VEVADMTAVAADFVADDLAVADFVAADLVARAVQVEQTNNRRRWTWH